MVVDSVSTYGSIPACITLAGSALSAITTLFVLICFAISRRSQRSFRHALVFNLALSDFINSSANTISGAIYIRNGELLQGMACTFDGWIGQLSVQATDFSILAISLATLTVVLQKHSAAEASLLKKTLICLSVWVVPLITSTVATSMGAMQPVGGNWCWIANNQIALRYSLTHGWRFLIMLITIIVYTYIWRHISCIWGRLSDCHSPDETSTRRKSCQRKNAPSNGDSQEQLATPLSSLDKPSAGRDQTVNSIDIRIVSQYNEEQTRRKGREIKHMLLLSGYPIAYIILWIPGLMNRIIEATGSTAISPSILAFLQIPAQFVGFANAVTYSFILIWKERTRRGDA